MRLQPVGKHNGGQLYRRKDTDIGILELDGRQYAVGFDGDRVSMITGASHPEGTIKIEIEEAVSNG